MNERIETSAAGHYRTVLGIELSPRYGKNPSKNEWAAVAHVPNPVDALSTPTGVYWENLTVGVGHHRD